MISADAGGIMAAASCSWVAAEWPLQMEGHGGGLRRHGGHFATGGCGRLGRLIQRVYHLAH